MQVFVIINKDGMKINADVNAKNWLCNKGLVWNPSYCECECDKSCDVRKYLYHKNCKCRKRLADNEFTNVLKILMRKNYIQGSCTQIKWFITQL